jgi:CCT motif
MTDARTRFFDNMERELLEQVGGSGTRGDALDLDFAVTESGRTVMESHRSTSLEDYPCDSLRTLEDIRDETILPPPPPRPAPAPVSYSGIHPTNLEDYPCDSLRTLDGVHEHQQQHSPKQPSQPPDRPVPPRTRSIPVPKPATQQSLQFASSNKELPSSQPSSHGSSGSAFLNSVLNQNQEANPLHRPLSHTPPAISASYDHHFGKRMRAGSVSGRLRSASELFDEKQLDKNTKLLLKDLILIGDEQVQEALDQFENTGDSSLLEQMIASGMLQHRVPADLDLLDDLDLDFLNVHEDIPETHFPSAYHPASKASQVPSSRAATGVTFGEAPARQNPQTQRALQSNTVTPLEEDDGVGDFEFNEFANDYYSGGAGAGVKHAPQSSVTLGTSPPDSNLSEFERRMRSNSLFSALLNDNKLYRDDSAVATNNAERGLGLQLQLQHEVSWQDRHLADASATERSGIQINMSLARRSSPQVGGIAASLLAAAAATNDKDDNASMDSGHETEEEAEVEVQPKPQPRRGGRPPKDKKKDVVPSSSQQEEEQVHVSGSGLPRSLSDPCFRTTIDSIGLRQVERPDGWVGAYSPESRKVRIERFLSKRNHRVWSKTIKYDVRKNFADSRLRVKGRFVRKEDESLMRELMSLT